MPVGLTKSQNEPVTEKPSDTGSSAPSVEKPDHILILIPAYNEASRIGQVLGDIQKEVPNIPILVIDDGSRDATAEVARKQGASVITLPYNNGYGVALQTGFRYAHLHGYNLIVQMDADGQHDAAEVPRLIHSVQKDNVDVVVGSRFLNSDHYRPGSARRIGMLIFGLLASIFIKQRVTDPTSGFQAVRGKQAIRFIASDQFPPDYPDADFLILLHRCGFRLGEVPVKMRPSPPNKSMHGGTRAVYYVFKMFLSIFVTMLREKPRDF